MNLNGLACKTGIQTQQALETRAPGTDISVCDGQNLLLKPDKLGFQPSKQGGQELPGLIFRSRIVKSLLNLDKLGFQPSKMGDRCSQD